MFYPRLFSFTWLGKCWSICIFLITFMNYIHWKGKEGEINIMGIKKALLVSIFHSSLKSKTSVLLWFAIKLFYMSPMRCLLCGRKIMTDLQKILNSKEKTSKNHDLPIINMGVKLFPQCNIWLWRLHHKKN